MYRIISYYNRNKKKIWIIILVIAFAILILRLFNHIAKLENEEETQNLNNVIVDVEDTTTQVNYSVISGTNIEQGTTEENTTIIDDFILACNNGEIENAYNMLSNECKELKYPTLESFYNNYYKNIFTTYKVCNKEAWMTSDNFYTYRVVLKEDALSTGKITYENSFEDFYTIAKSENESKLNISSYVGREYINASNEKDNIKIEVVYKDIYMNYEIYSLDIENNRNSIIKLDSKEEKNSTVIVGRNGTIYSSHINEMEDYYTMDNNTEEDDNENTNTNSSKKNIVIPKYTNKNVEIKFNKIYNPSRDLIAMIFNDIILDLTEYENISNKSSYTKRIEIEIYFE